MIASVAYVVETAMLIAMAAVVIGGLLVLAVLMAVMGWKDWRG